MRARALIGCALVAAGCDRVLGLDDIQPPPSLSSYKYRKPVTVTNNGSMVDDFTIFVSIAADADLVAHARSDGSDITFGDTMTEYPSEPISYGADGTLQTWVSVPVLQPGPTTLYMYYGGPTRTNNASLAWASKYIAAWHLDDTGELTHDSAMTAHDANEMFASAPASVPGIAGNARAFTSSPIGQPMCVTSTDFDFGTNSFAYSAWVYVAQAPPDDEAAVYKGGSSPSSAGFDFELTAGSVGISLNDASGGNQITAGAGTLATNRWTLAAASIDRTVGTVHAFVDGVGGGMANISSLGSVSDPTQPLCLGAEHDGTFPLLGYLDEVRIYAKNLDADWFHLEYEMLVAPDQVIAIGPEMKVR